MVAESFAIALCRHFLVQYKQVADVSAALLFNALFCVSTLVVFSCLRVSVSAFIFSWCFRYDGERMQLHKDGKQLLFFRRNLTRAHPSKIEHVLEFVAQACTAEQMILDGELILIELSTGYAETHACTHTCTHTQQQAASVRFAWHA